MGSTASYIVTNDNRDREKTNHASIVGRKHGKQLFQHVIIKSEKDAIKTQECKVS